MNLDSLIEKMNRLEYHQSILLKMISKSDDHFYKLIVERSLNKQDVENFYKECNELMIELEEQQAEGFVYFESLLKKFKESLHPNLDAEEVILACLRQKLFLPLMIEFKKYI
ncbi:DUF1878 family protein [Robertmurraya yapensis]|uniref:DUF1878 family protein n=1 Tax=Bacillus yapensis TaxID=2492960 RepID=A0A3S0RLL7_9BACI|nr:DUF1878 family protein [Bacillus yapensis]RTR31423.1 DUF1878 family protein [Bacillus yapensis]TKS95647.1 DUF1878 family protein [Bacillus yapensis]